MIFDGESVQGFVNCGRELEELNCEAMVERRA